MSRSVCEAVVARDLCIGCGVCAATCPESALTVEFNRFGELVARESGLDACRNCGKCLSVCPFSPQAENEDVLARLVFPDEPGIRWLPETGYYCASFAGHVNADERRISRSSGGLATWFLDTLLTREVVDRVVCVGTGEESPFAYRVMTDAGEVQGSARSGYYPVTLSSVLREVRGTNDRVAIVGLPCFVKGVRLAVKQDSQLGRRVRVLAGLVCGGTRSRFYAEYLCALGGGMPNALEQVDFRVKEGSERAGEFGFRFSCRAGSGRNEGMVAAQERGRLWSQRYFEPRACRFCDDVFCETADVVFMDAWLDRYMRDPRGTNLVLTRKTWITDLLVQAAEAGAVTLEDVPVTDLICSQQEVTRRKRALLAERLAASADDAVPDRRLRPAVIGALRRAQLRMAERLIGRSREAFADALERSEGPADVIQDFKQAMRGPETLARLGRGLARRLSGRRANQPIEQRDVAARPAESLAGRIS